MKNTRLLSCSKMYSQINVPVQHQREYINVYKLRLYFLNAFNFIPHLSFHNKWPFSFRHLVYSAAESEPINAIRVWLILQHFGRHESNCACASCKQNEFDYGF